jgi:hypothetical protein
MKNIDTEENFDETIEKACPLGIILTCKVLKVTKTPKIKIKLAIGKKYFANQIE